MKQPIYVPNLVFENVRLKYKVEMMHNGHLNPLAFIGLHYHQEEISYELYEQRPLGIITKQVFIDARLAPILKRVRTKEYELEGHLKLYTDESHRFTHAVFRIANSRLITDLVMA